MKKHYENKFIDKFCILQTQESSEEISWSCSDSSDYEYGNVNCRTLNNITNGIGRKRKRRNNKKKEPNNISNLDVTIEDTSKEHISSVISATSPILVQKSKFGVMQKSPILTPLQYVSKTTDQKDLNNSAPTCYNHFKVSSNEKYVLKSPIMQFKNSYNKISPNVKKKLFKGESIKNNQFDSCKYVIENDRDKPSFNRKKACLDRRKYEYNFNENNLYEAKADSDVIEKNQRFKDFKINFSIAEKNYHEECIDSIKCSSSEDSASKKSHTELVAKVKSYFDNYFISEASQLSISECETPTPKNSSKSSNEIDIITPKTQENNVTCLSKDIPMTSTFENNTSIPKKKVRYKKGGLAGRLDALLRKQNSSVTLWQHERFLAANSNFVIPKQDYLVFRIKNIYFKYGIYLLDIVNKDDEFFIVIINSLYVKTNSFEVDGILKIYEPFKIVNIDKDCRIICKMSKFVCEKMCNSD